MAKEAKKKLPQFTTPRGVFVFPKLTEPDYGSKDFPKPDGEYSLKLRMAQADADAFIARKNKDGVSLGDMYADALRDAEAAFAELPVATRKKLEKVKPNELFTVLYDEETEEPTGEVEFRFKMKASGEFKKGPKAGQKWHRKPDLFDAKGRKIGGGVNIWGGSEGKVSFVGSPYFIPGTAAAGLRLMLGGVQVIELVSNGSRAADSYGFGEEEGFGYDPDEYREETTGEDTSGEGAGDAGAAGEEDF